MKPLCIELYVRAIAVDVDDMETRKSKADKVAIKSAEISLATQFSKLADLVRADVQICKEVALTAFSLHPTKERFEKLVELAVLPLKTAPTSASGAVVEGEIGSGKVGSSVEEDAKQETTTSASLGVPESVIEDIVTVVGNCRWDVLTWRKGWAHLEPLCQRYMAEQDKMTSVTKELNFLEIDYSRFKDIPRPERGQFWGIEKGFEKCLDPQYDETAEKNPPPVKAKRQKKSSKSTAESPSSVDKPKKVSKKKSPSPKTPSAPKKIPKVEPEGVKRSTRIQNRKVCFSFYLFPHLINLIHLFVFGRNLRWSMLYGLFDRISVN